MSEYSLKKHVFFTFTVTLLFSLTFIYQALSSNSHGNRGVKFDESVKTEVRTILTSPSPSASPTNSSASVVEPLVETETSFLLSSDPPLPKQDTYGYFNYTKDLPTLVGCEMHQQFTMKLDVNHHHENGKARVVLGDWNPPETEDEKWRQTPIPVAIYTCGDPSCDKGAELLKVLRGSRDIVTILGHCPSNRTVMVEMLRPATHFLSPRGRTAEFTRKLGVAASLMASLASLEVHGRIMCDWSPDQWMTEREEDSPFSDRHIGPDCSIDTNLKLIDVDVHTKCPQIQMRRFVSGGVEVPNKIFDLFKEGDIWRYHAFLGCFLLRPVLREMPEAVQAEVDRLLDQCTVMETQKSPKELSGIFRQLYTKYACT